MIFPIGTDAVGVETEGDLRNAVSISYNIEYIYLANNITLTQGIDIYEGKTRLTIDGEYPLNSGNKNTFTNFDSFFSNDTLGIRNTSEITLTLKNMVINGFNYYGVPYVAENTSSINTDNVSVIYENVIYVGPQMTYNCNGFTRYVDCDITIMRTGVLSAAQEVGEVNRLEIGGNTVIRHESTTSQYAVFWFRDNNMTTSFTVLSGANIDIVSLNNYFMYNRESELSSLVPVNYIIESGANLSLTANRGISYNGNHQIESFTIGENASFSYLQTADNIGIGSLWVNGAITVESGARFSMQSSYGSHPLIVFTSGTGRSFNVDNPFSFWLYRPNYAAIRSDGTTNFTFRSGQLNTWDSATTPIENAGGINDAPPHKWFKKKYASLLEINGSFTSSNTMAFGNLEPEDAPFPPLTDLLLHNFKVMSMGNFAFLINPVRDDGSFVSGWTEPNANSKAEYDIGITGHTVYATANNIGRFEIDTSHESPPEIPEGTAVKISVNIPFLIKDAETTAIDTDDFYIESAPGIINFITSPVSLNPVLLPRETPEVPIDIRDMRSLGYSTQWELLATVTGQLEGEDGHVLKDAVVYVANQGDAPVPLGSFPVSVFTGGPDIQITEVEWLQQQGILINVTAPIHSGITYSTNVVWELCII